MTTATPVRMPMHLLPTTMLAAGLLLVGCAADAPEAAMTDATADAADRPLVAARTGTSTPAGELRIRTVLSGGGAADLVVEHGRDQQDVTLQAGASTEVFGHTLELVRADPDTAVLAVTAPDGTRLGVVP